MRAAETTIGPVGFAETISTCTRSRPRRPAAAVALADLGERVEEERVADPQVDEAGAGDLGRLDLVERRDLLRELLREVARRPADRLGRAHGDVRREVPVRWVLRPLELDVGLRDRADARREAFDALGSSSTALVSSSRMDDEGSERQLNIHWTPQHLAGVYANFANITFSDYEFTLTFARIDHEVEEGDVPGVVVSRVNMSQQFMRELLAAMQDAYSKYTTVKGIQDLPETDDR